MRLACKVGVLTTTLASAVALAACGTVSGPSGTAPPTAQQVVQASPAPSSSQPAPGQSSSPGRGNRTHQGTPAARATRTSGAGMTPRTGGGVAGPSAPAVSTAHPDHVIGHGTPASCTSQAVVRAVAAGGVITF